MSLEYTVEHRAAYSVVRLAGEPTLGEFVAFIQRLGTESARWPNSRALFDLREIHTLTTFTEHYAIGQEVGRELRHMKRMASLVPPDRITRASEKTARQAGVTLTVFTNEQEALAWLASDAP